MRCDDDDGDFVDIPELLLRRPRNTSWSVAADEEPCAEDEAAGLDWLLLPVTARRRGERRRGSSELG